jgi:hypothetical protein
MKPPTAMTAIAITALAGSHTNMTPASMTAPIKPTARQNRFGARFFFSFITALYQRVKSRL